jgi:hypothetical protein
MMDATLGPSAAPPGAPVSHTPLHVTLLRSFVGQEHAYQEDTRAAQK